MTVNQTQDNEIASLNQNANQTTAKEIISPGALNENTIAENTAIQSANEVVDSQDQTITLVS